jgi:hypothetical protein
VFSQLWVGDTEQQVPPLKHLKLEDVKHIDKIGLATVEKEQKVGPNRDKRRMAKKYLTDMRFICNFLYKKVEDLGKLEETITLSAVDWMFVAISDLVLEGERDSQLQWLSVVRQLRKKKGTTLEEEEDLDNNNQKFNNIYKKI